MIERPVTAEFFEKLANSTELLLAPTSDQVGYDNRIDDPPAKRIDGGCAPAQRLSVGRNGWNGQRG